MQAKVLNNCPASDMTAMYNMYHVRAWVAYQPTYSYVPQAINGSPPLLVGFALFICEEGQARWNACLTWTGRREGWDLVRDSERAKH